VCSAEKNRDLFYGFPNSYGTFGYALRLKVKLIPVKPFVKISHARYSDATAYFQAIEKVCARGERADSANPDAIPDFVDGTMFGPDEMYITTGTFVNTAPFVSDYTYKNIYYKSIRTRKEDYLSVYDYIWRWDTDWFWCSKAFGAQNPLIRMLFGKKRLNSATYWKMRNFAENHQGLLKLASPFSRRESVIQDIDIPIENAPQYEKFFFDAINIRPVWICPFRAYEKIAKFNFYSFDPEKLYINFGFWNSVATTKEKGYYNRLIEAKISELKGKKGLYSDSYYTEKEFWDIYDKALYDALKQKYDPQGKLKNLFDTCVKRE
jgi:FAD/FMN-containing dehydrogenase